MKKTGNTGAMIMDILCGAVFSLVSYVLMQYSGLFRPASEGIFHILHQWPSLVGFGLLIAASLAGLVELFLSLRRQKGSGVRQAIPLFILYFGLISTGTGIFVSSLTRFEGTLTLTEGQQSDTSKKDFDPATLYMRRFSRLPDEKITLLEVAPFVNGGGKMPEKTYARISCKSPLSGDDLDFGIGSGLPGFANGFIYRIGNKGYSVLVQLFESTGDFIDGAYVILKIFPPGTEDSFRIFEIPYTFFLRYYPDAKMVQDRISVTRGKTGPLFRVRIARNLDLVANGYFSPGDLVQVDSFLVSFGHLRRWVEIRIVRDPGMFLLIPGLVLVAAGVLFLIIKKINELKGQGVLP